MKDGKEQWSTNIDCAASALLVRSGKLYLLGSWSHSYKALARMDIKSGALEWALPLTGMSGDFRLAAEDDESFWFFDEDSYLQRVYKESGDITLSLRLVDRCFTSPLTAFYRDPASDRLLIDPSSGMIYSFPRSSFAGTFALQKPAKQQSSFGYAFQKEVFVEESDIGIQTGGQADDPSSQLFSRFASTFGGSKFNYSTKGWRERWKEVTDAMIAAAKKQGLDAGELQACFEVIAPAPDERTAITPVSAHRISFGGEAAWVIVCNWEYDYKDDKDLLMGHVRIWAISPKTKKILAFATCG
jgi:hypothetical protein